MRKKRSDIISITGKQYKKRRKRGRPRKDHGELESNEAFRWTHRICLWSGFPRLWSMSKASQTSSQQDPEALIITFARCSWANYNRTNWKYFDLWRLRRSWPTRGARGNEDGDEHTSGLGCKKRMPERQASETSLNFAKSGQTANTKFRMVSGYATHLLVVYPSQPHSNFSNFRTRLLFHYNTPSSTYLITIPHRPQGCIRRVEWWYEQA